MIEKVQLFSSLHPKAIIELEAIARRHVFPRNSLVINEGDVSDSLYVLVSGKAVAMRSDESGRLLVINRFGPWDYFGEMSFFDRSARCATVMTKERCEVLVIPRGEFLGFVKRHQEILWNMINALLAKVRRATEQIENLAFLDVYGRLARFLVENQNADGVIPEKFTQQELADVVGASRET
ncbi:MAG: Crp/Fnr family transcriptional regulator, partial [Desulfatitalea sp.]|nr:Crp/Fnr family transcriptional regulator [Desulfatitalea sp.]